MNPTPEERAMKALEGLRLHRTPIAVDAIASAILDAILAEREVLRDIVDAHKDCRHGRCRAWDQWRTDMFPGRRPEPSEYCYDNIEAAIRARSKPDKGEGIR